MFAEEGLRYVKCHENPSGALRGPSMSQHLITTDLVAWDLDDIHKKVQEQQQTEQCPVVLISRKLEQSI